MTYRGSLIDIRAEQVPLINILKAISEQAGISLKVGDSMTEPVSLELKGTSIEKCLRRLLTNRSYALLFKKDDHNRLVPVELRVVGGQSLEGSTKRVPHTSRQPPRVARTASPLEGPVITHRGAWFERTFRDVKKLSRLVAADPAGEGPDGSGIRITRVSRGSVFDKVGLRPGDIIHAVNGQPVQSVDEFIGVLQVAPKEQPIIMIERTRKNAGADPIYIELY